MSNGIISKKVNDLITLKLVGNNINLFIKGLLFIEDLVRLIDSDIFSIESLTNVEIFRYFYQRLKKWVDNKYNINLLQSELAFPILEELSNKGDTIARKTFKNEIIVKIRNNSLDDVSYLLQDPIYNNFTTRELKPILDEIGLDYVLFKGKIYGIVLNNRLDLRNRYIDNLAKIDRLDSLTSLKELLLGRNQLSVIPDTFLNLCSLRSLDLFSNQFKVFPEIVIELDSLESLNLGWNQLETLPDTIGDFGQLKELFLNRNNLIYLPSSIGNIKTLHTLILNFNNLTELPESMGNLVSIKKLGLRSNNLLNLPASISDLNSLEELDISFNNFRKLPDSLTYFYSLKRLWINLENFNAFNSSIKILRERNVKINNS